MIDKNDMLYLVFEKHLLKHTNEEQPLEVFANDVVEDYLLILAKQGVTVPGKLRQVLEMDLMEEVIEMTRKKTYGHLTLQEFRQKNVKLIEVYLKKSA